jgi:hypothetical protein
MLKVGAGNIGRPIAIVEQQEQAFLFGAVVGDVKDHLMGGFDVPSGRHLQRTPPERQCAQQRALVVLLIVSIVWGWQ